MPLEYEQPVIQSGFDKPLATENKPLSYNQLADSRRFEELVYSIYKSEIDAGCFGGFDNISLMSGVRDKGRDCALHKNGKNHGLIQCKKYESSVTKDQFGEEISKFVLYSLLEPTLIHDINDFTYYIAVSTPFVGDCSEFIDDFNSRIAGESKLQKWIQVNTAKPTLQLYRAIDKTKEVLNILSHIKVRKILPVDMDALLSEPRNQKLLPLFFAVRTVVDISSVERLEQKFDRLSANELTREELSLQLSRSSVTIMSQRNQFECIPESHISRSETEELFTWITNPAQVNNNGQDENMCLLAANAGMGKTVIIKDLYEQLRSKNIPVLALKADRLYATSMNELKEKISLSVPVFDFIEQCKQKFSSLVILIDQIDALSQSLSSDRSFLHTYQQLIDTYKFDSNIRIIISVRMFDLLYDPSLRVYKNIRTVEVKKLTTTEVLTQLQKIGLNDDKVSDNLLALLQTPNNLDVFSRIYSSTSDFAGINTIQDLYNELWREKILDIHSASPVDSNRVIDLLYFIAEAMNAQQKISVSEHLPERWHKELNYLKSEQLIKIENRELQFFHQSFYDYIYAKQFVENNRSVIKYVKAERQSIMIRSSLKMILGFLRDHNHGSYIKDLAAILKSRSIFFHVKHLLISMIAVADNPSAQEKELFTKLIETNAAFLKVFYQHTIGKEWMLVLKSRNLIARWLINPPCRTPSFWEKYLAGFKPIAAKQKLRNEGAAENLIYQLLRRNIACCSDDILDLLDELDNAQLTDNVLYFSNRWDNPKAFALLKKHKNYFRQNNWRYLHLLDNITESNPQFVLEEIKDEVLKSDDTAGRNEEHEVQEIFEKLFGKLPSDMSRFVFMYIKKRIEERAIKEEYTRIFSDYAIEHFNFDESKHHLKRTEYLYKLLAESLRKQAQNGTEFFKEFLSENRNSLYKSVLRLLVFALQTNEEKYSQIIFELLIHFSDNQFLSSYGNLNMDIRLLLKHSFQYFTPEQKSEIVALIKEIRGQKEIGVWSHGSEKQLYSYHGLTKYYFLLCLPDEVITSDKKLKREMQELRRKHGTVTERRTGITAAGVVHAPLSGMAYVKMNNAQWIQSFKTYNDEFHNRRRRHDNDYLKGGMLEHSRAFCSTIKENPSRYFNLLAAIIPDKEIPTDYTVEGIKGVLESKKYPGKVLEFIKLILQRDLTNTNVLYLMWMIDDLIATDFYDKELLDFVIFHALHNSNPETDYEEEPEAGRSRIDGLVSKGINSVRGAAAKALTYIPDAKFENEVFGTLNRILTDDFNSVKAAAIYRYAYLMNVNNDKAFDLFVSAMKLPSNRSILKSGLWTLQYLIHYDFEKLIPYIEAMMCHDHLSDTEIDSLCAILLSAWLHDYPNAEALFKHMVEQYPQSHSMVLHNAFQTFYFKEEISEKSIQLIESFLNDNGKKVVRRFEIEMHHLENIKFTDVYPVLLKYVHSKSFILSDYFLDYLTMQSAQHVCDCIELFERALQSENTPDESESFFLRKEGKVTRFIIGAYASLQKERTKKSERAQFRLLKVFDAILQDDRFNSNIENVLEKVVA